MKIEELEDKKKKLVDEFNKEFKQLEEDILLQKVIDGLKFEEVKNNVLEGVFMMTNQLNPYKNVLAFKLNGNIHSIEIDKINMSYGINARERFAKGIFDELVKYLKIDII